MLTKSASLKAISAALLLTAAWAGVAAAQGPDHPVITEMFQDPPGNDGPVGRILGNRHQEFIEIYLPPAAGLAPGLNKDALRLTFYEVEGDSDSPGLALVNYRIDLPTFDLDPSNGLTAGAVARPPSGAVVLGWVDYVGGNPPTNLAGTPSTRVGLVNGGITSATNFTFIAINGAQFSGTTNFPVPVAISHLNLNVNSDPVIGKIEQGSGVYMLVNRDDPGYAQLCGQTDPAGCNSFPDLPSGGVLGTSSLLDGFAGNDDGNFDPTQQPYNPTNCGLDLECVLPRGGAFSLLAAQVKEQPHGYARRFVDIVKTTEAGGNPNPVADSLNAYRTISNLVGATPGRVHFTTSPAELELADASLQVFQVLTYTKARPGIVAANIGGPFGMSATATPGPSSNPAAMVLSGGVSSVGPPGPVLIFPEVVVETFETTAPGHTQVVTVQVNASKGMVSDPPVVNPSASVTATYTAIDPTRGLDAAGNPFQATSFIAIQGLPNQVGVANEFVGTSLGQFVKALLGGPAKDTRGNGALLVDPNTDLSNPAVVDPLVATIPQDPAFYINAPGAPGTDDLVNTVKTSAEVVSGKSTYADSFNGSQTLLKAREFPIPETKTCCSSFTPMEDIHYADAAGLPGAPQSGLTSVQTRRGSGRRRNFELAILDTNLGPSGFVETGATDDFGLIVKVGQTLAGSPVVPGEFVFLSFTGGLEGADVDTLDVPPHGILTDIIYVDLEPLQSVLGVDTITRLFVVDGSGSGEIDPIEVFSLPEPDQWLTLPALLGLLLLLGRRHARGPRHQARSARG